MNISRSNGATSKRKENPVWLIPFPRHHHISICMFHVHSLYVYFICYLFAGNAFITTKMLMSVACTRAYKHPLCIFTSHPETTHSVFAEKFVFHTNHSTLRLDMHAPFIYVHNWFVYSFIPMICTNSTKHTDTHTQSQTLSAAEMRFTYGAHISRFISHSCRKKQKYCRIDLNAFSSRVRASDFCVSIV